MGNAGLGSLGSPACDWLSASPKPHGLPVRGSPARVSHRATGGGGGRKEEHGPAKAGLHVRLEALLQS